MAKSIYDFKEKIHATILNPYLTKEDFKVYCDLISEYNLKNISTSLGFLKYLKNLKSRNNLKINTLISYPLSDIPEQILKELIDYAIEEGADGIEYVPKFFLLSKNNEEDFANDIENIYKSDLPITLIFNKSKLNEDIFVKAIKISLEIGIEKFQFGDGFNTQIRNTDIREIRSILNKNILIKAAGGINNLNQVIELLNDGLDCVGTSNFHNIFKTIKLEK